jgi:hypothetical protein
VKTSSKHVDGWSELLLLLLPYYPVEKAMGEVRNAEGKTRRRTALYAACGSPGTLL